MKQRAKIRKEQQNKGFSLVELLVALAIFAIAGAAVFGFATYSANHYARTSEAVKLQYEQQLAVNQLRDVILEATNGIYYNETAGELVIYSENTDTAGTVSYPVIKVSYDSVNHKLYLSQKVFLAAADVSLSSFSAADKKLLAENVTAFSVDLSRVKKDKVKFSITFSLNDNIQTVSPVVALRNHILVSEETDEIYTGEEATKDSFIKSIAIQRAGKTFSQTDTDKIGKSGDSVTVKYTALVTANEDSDASYAVMFSSNTTNAGISVNSDGTVTVSGDVTTGTIFTLKAASVDDPTKYAEIDVLVEENGIYPVSAAIAESKTTGNGFWKYLITPTITYTNGTVSHDGEKLTWKNVENLPAGCTFTIDEESKCAVLYLTESANGHEITLYAVTQETDVNGNLLPTNKLIINPEVPPYQAGPTLKLNTNETLSRGGSALATITWVNGTSSDYTYYWNVSPYSDGVSSDWGNGNNSLYSFQQNISALNNYYNDSIFKVTESGEDRLVLRTASSIRMLTVKCGYDLYWQQAFKLKISVRAVNNKDGSEVTSEEKVITIEPVTLNLIPLDTVYGNSGYKTDSTIVQAGDWRDEYRYFTMQFAGLDISSNVSILWQWNPKHSFMFYNSYGGLVSNVQLGETILQPYANMVGFKTNLSNWRYSASRPVRMKYWFGVKMNTYNTVTSENDLEYLLEY